MLCSREGNSSSSIALIMHYRHTGLSTYVLNGLYVSEISTLPKPYSVMAFVQLADLVGAL